MLAEPSSHLLISPRPLKGMGIEAVVLRPGGQYMFDELHPILPRAPLQVVIAERPYQQLRLVQPRRMGRREAGSPPAPTARTIRRRVAGGVTGVAVLDQEYALQAPVPPPKGPQFPD